MSERKCAACGSADLEFGFLPELLHGGGVGMTTWVSGPPQRSAWTGLKVTHRPRYYVEAHGCRACGFLNLYVGLPINPPASGQPT
ncbi:hypothetical protein [Labedaea rhizosphaerae]|uniref:Uncharacterized protein n=1 Tax=Labedaea rhizosphaerae TaxID=598644 RepID=A0A4R6SMW5_LABRH|nr:hypothetical protein [Labedaea rhizosphaerae]TDQ05357.1 hypothetical protein EV186_1011327 [Labedaea rhizosphaerae]